MKHLPVSVLSSERRYSIRQGAWRDSDMRPMLDRNSRDVMCAKTKQTQRPQRRRGHREILFKTVLSATSAALRPPRLDLFLIRDETERTSDTPPQSRRPSYRKTNRADHNPAPPGSEAIRRWRRRPFLSQPPESQVV